jgi:hypothetical protein
MDGRDDSFTLVDLGRLLATSEPLAEIKGAFPGGELDSELYTGDTAEIFDEIIRA